MARHQHHPRGPEPTDTSPIWRVERALGSIDILGWLESQPHAVKMYWRSRDSKVELAGVGVADQVSAGDVVGIKSLFEYLHTQTQGSDAGYFGGLCFDSLRTPRDDAWGPFGDFRFVLPLVEVVRRGEKVTLSMNALRSRIEEDGAEEALADLKLLRESDKAGVFMRPALGPRQDYPNSNDWRRTIEESLARINARQFDKVVLARRSDFPTEAPASPWGILKRLRRRSEGRYLFGFQPAEGAAFVGATPERLYRREGSSIESEALAGTRGVSEVAETDRRLANELLASEKDRREHQHVVDHLAAAFQALCDNPEIAPSPQIARLDNVQHLRTHLRGKLRDGVDDATILRTLHPTPAVGGAPRAAALEHLRQAESFDRGWYAGPIGRIASSSAEFAVAIRSALIRPSCLSLFAGAGIVHGSEAGREWDEIENKISPFLEIWS